MNAKLWLLLVLLLLTLVVGLQNSEVVTVRFLFWRAEVSGFLLVLMPLLAGAAVGFLGAKIASRAPRDR